MCVCACGAVSIAPRLVVLGRELVIARERARDRDRERERERDKERLLLREREERARLREIKAVEDRRASEAHARRRER